MGIERELSPTIHDWIATDVLALVHSEYLDGGCEDDKVRVRVLRSGAYFFAEKVIR